MVNWEEIRSKEYAPLDKNDLILFMAASASPLSKTAKDSAVWYFNELHEHGDINFERFVEDLQTTRKMVAEYLNCKSEEITFMINTSSGITTIAQLFEQERGQIIYPSVEFPASIHAFKRNGYPCKKIEHVNNVYDVDHFNKYLTPETRYLVHSYVQSLTGFKQDLDKVGEFCKDNGLISIINATQAFGSLDIDVKKQNIDILVSNGLKWIGGGFGIGILYIKEELIQKRKLPFTGWLSVEDPFGMDNDNMNIIHEVSSMDSFGGCPNLAALYSLKGALELIKNDIGKGDINSGVHSIQERIIKLTSELIDHLSKNDFKLITPLELNHRSGIITFEHEDAKEIHEKMTEKKIYTSLKRYPKAMEENLIRVAINHYNNNEDITRLINHLSSIEKI